MDDKEKIARLAEVLREIIDLDDDDGLSRARHDISELAERARKALRDAGVPSRGTDT